EEDEEFLGRGRAGQTLVVGTKADLAGGDAEEGRVEVLVSARTGLGLEALRALLASRLGLVEADGELLVLERHREALVSAASSLREAAALAGDLPSAPELVAARVREALTALGVITGETATEELLDRIFATFCVGKESGARWKRVGRSSSSAGGMRAARPRSLRRALEGRRFSSRESGRPSDG